MSNFTRDDLINAWKEGYAQGRNDPFTEEGPDGYGEYHAAAEACADTFEAYAATLHQAERVDEVKALRACALKYLGWLNVRDPAAGLEADMRNPEVCGEAALSAEPVERQGECEV